MKREDIEEAAKAESGAWAPSPVHLQDIYRRDDFEAGFHSGVNWIKDNLWHDIKEVPQRLGEFILMSGPCECTALIVPVNIEEWNRYVRIYNSCQWLYVNDIRDTED